MSRLYRIRMDGELLVVAESKEEAENLVLTSVGEVIASGSFKANFDVRQIEGERKQYFEDIHNVVPFNTGSYTFTVAEWFEENLRQEEEAEYARLQTFFEGSGPQKKEKLEK